MTDFSTPSSSAPSSSSPTLGLSRTEWIGFSKLVFIIFCGFLAVGAPLAALSLYVHDELGFSTVTVGVVIGVQSLATLASRHWGGTLSDRRGPRDAVLIGLPLAAAAGLLYVVSAVSPFSAVVRLVIVVVGRIVLGFGESLFATGTMSWGIARVGAGRTGLVMSWQGIAMYAALGLGAPLGLALAKTVGFVGVGLLGAAAPLAALLVARTMPASPAIGGQRIAFHRVIGRIWRFGLVLTLASVPFAGMAAFLPLYYAARGWDGAGLGITAFGLAYVAARLVGSTLPDRFGGVRVVIVCLSFQILGQMLLWSAGTPHLALFGSFLTGIGYSLVFPSMGVMATQSLPPEHRGRAVANFIAFFDLSIGLTSPLVGTVTGAFGFASVFIVGAVAAATGILLVATIKR